MIFLLFMLKHRLCVLVRTVSVSEVVLRVPTIYIFLTKIRKNIYMYIDLNSYKMTIFRSKRCVFSLFFLKTKIVGTH